MLTELQLQNYKERLSALEHFSSLSDEQQTELLQDIFSHPYMDLRCDWAFKYILNDDEVLKILLEDMLPGNQIESVKRLPNELVHPLPDDKSVIFDVVCETPSGKMIVEMQRAKKPGFKNRMVYYGASMIQSQLRKKSLYTELLPVYVICFMDYGFKGNRQLISRYALHEQETHELYGNQLWIYLCNLKAFKKKSISGLSSQETWLYILKNMINFAGDPKEMGERYSKVADAARMHPLSEDQQFNYVFAMLSEQEKLEIREAYYQDGFDDGMEKGMEKGRFATAQAMLAKRYPVSEIAEVTGLTVEVIKQMK